MQDFSFEQLTASTEITVSSKLQDAVQTESENCFPDDDGVCFNITHAVQSGSQYFVEVTPSENIGYEKFVYEMSPEYKILRGYAWEDGRFMPHFST